MRTEHATALATAEQQLSEARRLLERARSLIDKDYATPRPAIFGDIAAFLAAHGATQGGE